jgi:hypothetical protein
MKVNVKKCERCGKDHDGLEFAELISPVIIDNEEYPWVGQCPATHERIFVKIVEHTRKEKQDGR